MAFSIGMQAFLADRYYARLKARFPDQTDDAMLTAFHRYAWQRGFRAAQRAVRDKAPLNFENYQKYREVVSTPEMKKIDPPSTNAHTLTHEEFVGRTYTCLTHDLFRQWDSPAEVELLFCRHIDSLNVAGFNPDLHYVSESTLYQSPCCVQRSLKPEFGPDMQFGVRMPDAPPYPFIIANEYYAMRQVFEAIFGQGGADAAEEVRQDFINTYGQADWDEVERYKDADFDIYYPKCLK
ncbi:MAG: L-2-amino-thiazoline-4-carboxylic acid hydrolase [Butyricicoccaceae bacterium]